MLWRIRTLYYRYMFLGVTVALLTFCACVQIIYDAPAKQNKAFLGLIYDKLARAKWAQRAAANEPGFDVNLECLKVLPCASLACTCAFICVLYSWTAQSWRMLCLRSIASSALRTRVVTRPNTRASTMPLGTGVLGATAITAVVVLRSIQTMAPATGSRTRRHA